MGQIRDLLVSLACRLLSLPFAVFSPGLPSGRSFSAIVVFKPCCIGDVVNATPALAALREAYPKARLAFVVGDWAREAIQHNHLVDEVVGCGTVGSGQKQSRREYLDLVRRIRRGRFDLAVVLDRSPLVSIIPFLAGISHRAGIDSADRGFSLTIKSPLRRNRHEAELYLDVVRALGINPGPHRSCFPVADADRSRADAILAGAEKDAGRPGEKLAMVHPGGAVNPGMVLSAKRWLPDRYAAIARRLVEEGWTVLLAGAASDRSVVDGIVSSLDTAGQRATSGIVDMVGRLSLGEFAAVAARCGLFVGNDSGPTHVAAAVGTPTVAVFGPSNPEMYAPYGPRASAVYNKVTCSPCFVDGRFVADCRDFKCMQAVEVEHVWQAIAQVRAKP
ncbi:MAG: glycosyltransferase family 9 protein [Chloroflexi bacterium]|nr:glycosyltransferase family 9 protein [Chloroflexota bacterium]